MQDLLTRGIDEHGNLRSEQTHQFKDSPLGRIPVEWDVQTLAQCAHRVVVGLASSTTHAYRDVGIPMIRNQNIRKGFFDDRDMLYLDSVFAASFPNKAARKGDVLTVRTGANVGDTAIVPSKYVGSPTFTTLITSTKNEVLLPEYLVLYVESQFGQSELNRIMVGGGKENLNVGQFVNFRIVLPRPKEQKSAVEYTAGVRSEIADEKVTLAKYRKIKTALMQDLLMGKKRVTPLLSKIMVTK
jgi:type I restriction enzyme S subunit